MDVPLRVLYEEFCSNPLVTGVTFSGGEPFIQSKSLAVLANVLKRKITQFGLILVLLLIN